MWHQNSMHNGQGSGGNRHPPSTERECAATINPSFVTYYGRNRAHILFKAHPLSSTRVRIAHISCSKPIIPQLVGLEYGTYLV